MRTAETINLVCGRLGVTKSELAKRMGMHPSSLYRKLSRESMTFEEFQKCLDVLGVSIEFTINYPDGDIDSSQVNQELLFDRMSLLEEELEVAEKALEFHKKTIKELRTEMHSASGYADLGVRHGGSAEKYLLKIQSVLLNMESVIACVTGDSVTVKYDDEDIDVSDLQGRRVLIVDDNQLNREMLHEMLHDIGIETEEAADGSEAVAIMKDNIPGYFDYILMDIEMPVMDGFEAARVIRSMPNRIRAHVPIIALTANDIYENRDRAFAVGMDDFLMKPADSASLLRSLARLK